MLRSIAKTFLRERLCLSSPFMDGLHRHPIHRFPWMPVTVSSQTFIAQSQGSLPLPYLFPWLGHGFLSSLFNAKARMTSGSSRTFPATFCIWVIQVLTGSLPSVLAAASLPLPLEDLGEGRDASSAHFCHFPQNLPFELLEMEHLFFFAISKVGSTEPV